MAVSSSGISSCMKVVQGKVCTVGEARGIRGQDIHLLFDATNAARQLYRLGEGGEWVRRSCVPWSGVGAVGK